MTYPARKDEKKMSNGDRFLSLDEFDEAFCARYTGFAAPAQEQMPPQYDMSQHDMSQYDMLGYQQQMPQYQAPQQDMGYQPQEQQMPQFQPQMPPQPEPYQTPEYQEYPPELPQFDDPFLMAAQSLPAIETAPQYPSFPPQNAPPPNAPPFPVSVPPQQWRPPVSPDGGYQAAPEQQAEFPAEEQEVLPPSPPKDKKRLTKQLIMIGVTAVLIILVAAGVLISKLAFGVEILSMNTTEMAPKIPLGSLVIIKKAEYGDIKKKNVIAYEFEKGKPIIRRVTRLHPETRSFSVKGDAAATSVTVSNDRMRGVVRRTVKYLGYPLYLLRSTVAKIAAAVVAVLLWAAIFFLISGYGKPKAPKDELEMLPPEQQVPPQMEQQPPPQMGPPQMPAQMPPQMGPQMPPPNPYYTT